MNTNTTNENGSNDLSKRNLEKLRHNILNFEKNINSFTDIKDKKEQILTTYDLNGLINILTQIKNYSLEEKLPDIVKLSEATCVFLNHINDLKYDFQDENIRDSIKYIIHNFKSLFLCEKGGNFELFLQYLNNPEDIFTKK